MPVWIKDNAMTSDAPRRLPLLLVLVAAAVAGLASLGWFAWRSPQGRFLPPEAGAEWVQYPVAPQVATFAFRYEQHTLFQRRFDLATAPEQARLRVRAFQGCSVTLNGRPVELPEAANWKEERRCDVAGLLRAGGNELRAVVSNDVGPPVLWLALEGPGWSLGSDAQWTASLDGAMECPAHPASQLIAVQAGSGAAGGDRTVDSFLARWPTLGLFAVVSGGVLLLLVLAARRTVALPNLALLLVVLLWVALFVNNTFRAPLFDAGFDAPEHLRYVQYIQDNQSLPLAEEGWEMHHPPLFYLLSAFLLQLFGLTISEESALLVFRALGLAAGVTQLLLIAASLRLLFPAQPRRQAVGLFLAAVLPAALYTCQYVTNEFLLMALGTASLYLGLRILQDEQPSAKWPVLLGMALGAALLTKVTALVVVGVVLLVLTGRLLARREWRPAAWLRGPVLVLLVTLVVSGWHYARVWSHYGTPLVGNFDVRSGFWFWQPPGFATFAYLGRFGQALSDPFFCALQRLPDGLYSTFWGDGLCGGVGAWIHRPPWNYDLMAAGFLLALVPCGLIGIGLVAAVVRVLRQPSAEWFLLLGILGGLAAALLYQVLRYPYYGHARAAYLLTGTLPVCALGALGFDYLARPGRAAVVVLAVLLGTWGLTAYASFWIDPHAAATLNWAGEQPLRARSYGEALRYFREAVEADPHAVPPRLNLARTLLAMNHPADARAVLEGVLRDQPEDADGLLLLSIVCHSEGRIDQAIALQRRAAGEAPDHPLVFPALGGALLEAGHNEEAIAAYRQALRVQPADPAVHADLGLLLARTGHAGEAIAQYRLAYALNPEQPAWATDLAWILATQDNPSFRDPEQALRLAEEACRRTQNREAVPLQSLAAALAANGRTSEAVAAARRAVGVAREASVRTALEEQLRRYEKGQPLFARAPQRRRPYASSLEDEWPTAGKTGAKSGPQ